MAQSPPAAARGLAMLWCLTFKGGRIVIMRAETLVHARLLAAANEGARAYLFDDGFLVDPEFEQMIPDELIGRTLSLEETTDLLTWLRGDARYGKKPAGSIAKHRRL
jgi:hypothetical protein